MLREVPAGDRSEDCYGFRCESSFSIVSTNEYQGQEPHSGVEPAQIPWPTTVNGNIFSGLTRVVWELNPVR